MQKLTRLLKTIDNNILYFFLFLFAFLIPLYPKLPIIDLEYTYIYIRFEDFFLVLINLIFLIQLLRKKVKLNTLFLKFFIFYWAVIVLSLIVGIFISHTLPIKGIAFLHTMRRFEYMSIFFIAASTITTLKQFKFLIMSLSLSVFLVNVYGVGQRFLGFPSISTMNPEFARGHVLFLTPEARINSTFAGHYDLAAFIVLLTPILWGIYFSFKSSKIFLIINVFLSYMTLMFTASRSSIIGYLATPLFLLFMKKFKYAVIVIILSGVIFMFNKDLSKRISQTFQIKQILVNEKTGQVYVPQQVTKKDLPAGGAIIDINSAKRGTNLTAQQRADLLKTATETGTLLTATDQARLLASQNDLRAQSSVVADTSFSARIQIEWPRAVHAFLKNPLIGTGASSITEATDGDYFRAIGEFGALGLISFLLILGSLLKYIYDKTKHLPYEERFIFIAMIFGTFALMINGILIDVFEASKVAFVFWFMMGIYIGYLSHKKYDTKAK